METRYLLLPALLLASLGALASCTTEEAPAADEGGQPDAEEVSMSGLPNGLALDERTVGAGQPDAETVQGLKDRGYVMAINLRRDGEEGSVPAEVIEGAGLGYAHVPIGGGDFTAEDARALRAALDQAPAEGKVLVYCGSGNRVGALWATMHALEKNLTPEQAVELARASGKVRDTTAEHVREVVAAERGE